LSSSLTRLNNGPLSSTRAAIFFKGIYAPLFQTPGFKDIRETSG
jgi:hypothetical protein